MYAFAWVLFAGLILSLTVTHTHMMNEVSVLQDDADETVHFRMARQTPGWKKFNQAVIDLVAKTSNKIGVIPFVVNVMCEPCIERMGKFACCFFITWFCCRNGTIPVGE